MNHSILRGVVATCAASLALFTTGCAIDSSRAEGREQHEREEHEHEPNPDDGTRTAQAKATGVTVLQNVKELGFFDGAGRVTCLVIDLADSNHMIAGGESGGLWKSTNRGKTWAPIDDHLPTLNVRSLSQNPINKTTYYASAYTMMTTTPGGNVYRPDIYKSTDNGQTFQLLPATAGTFSQVIKVLCDPNNASTVYALSDHFVGTARGLYRSTDNAQTFTQVLQIPAGTNVHDLEILPNGTVLVCAGNTIWRSTTGNTGSFTAATINGTNTFTAINIAFCQGSPNTLYGVSTGGNSGVGVFKSTDGGQNWSFAQSLTTGSFTRTVGVKPNNAAFVFAGSTGMYLSQNSGGSFVFYGTGGVDWWSVNFDPHNPDKVFNTFDQGIVEIGLNPFNPNNNTAYIRRDTLLNCAQIYAGDYFPIGDKVIAGMQDLGTRMTWITGELGVAGADGGQCFFNKQDTTVAYGTTQNGGIFKKTNLHIPFPLPGFTNPVDIANQMDGDNDGDIDEGAFFINPFYMNNADGQQLYFPTRKRLWRTIDGGTNWTPVSNFYTIPTLNGGSPFIEGTDKPNPIVYWGIGDTLHIMPNAKTATAAAELKVKMPGTLWGLKPDPANDSFVYITSNGASTGARIWHSSNLFKPNPTWTDITGDMPVGAMVRAIEVNPANKNVLVAGTNLGLYISTDGGAHWDIEQQLPYVSILRMKVRPSDNRLFIFTYGRGAWAASFPPSTGVNDAQQQTALTIWPNPAKDVIHIGIPQLTATTTVQVYSMDGRLVRTMSNLQNTPASLSLADMPAGTYLVALYEDGKRVKSGRVVKN